MKKIESLLIVEDDEITAFMVEAALRRLKAVNQFIKAHDGEDAKMVYLEREDKKPTVALIDLEMPGMSGWEFLDWYEQEGYVGSTKFAIYSSSSRPEDKIKALTYRDVVDFIEKPFQVDDISRLLESVN